MSSRRLKPLSLLASLAISALTLLAWTMTWFTVTLRDADDAQAPLQVAGDVAAPALAALSLAGLALVAALAISGPVFRLILGVLQAVIGLSVVWSAWNAIAAPVTTSAPLVTEATGITGVESIAQLIEAVAPTAWPVVTLLLGVLTAAAGVFIVITGSRWPVSARKYQAVRFEQQDEPRSSVSDWDSLSDGSDPTSR